MNWKIQYVKRAFNKAQPSKSELSSFDNRVSKELNIKPNTVRRYRSYLGLVSHKKNKIKDQFDSINKTDAQELSPRVSSHSTKRRKSNFELTKDKTCDYGINIEKVDSINVDVVSNIIQRSYVELRRKLKKVQSTMNVYLS